MVHVRNYTGNHVLAVLNLVGDEGRVGVQFFFMLSGFVLAWSRKANQPDRVFWRHRFARIYPAYAVTLLVGIALTFAEGGRVGPLVVLACLLLLQAWVPLTNFVFGLNYVAWSLSVETFFYAVTPALFRALERLRERLVLILGVVVALDLGLNIWAHALIHADNPPLHYWIFYIMPGKRLLDFTTGVLLAVLLQQGRLPQLAFRPALLTVAGTFAVGYVTQNIAWGETWMLLPFAALLVAGAQADLAGTGTIFSRPRLQRLGQASFCLYLVHPLVFRLVLLPRPSGHYEGLPAVVFVVGSMIAALLVAEALHRWVERPMERRLRGDHRVSVADGGPGDREGALLSRDVPRVRPRPAGLSSRRG